MADLRGFDASKVEPRSFEPIPAGKYVAIITDSEMRPTRAGDGEYLQLTFEIIEGEYQGRKLWTRLNLKNVSKTAMQIAYAELAAICRAVGVLQPQDSSELHNIPLVIGVRVQKQPQGLGNVIREYEPRRGNLAGTPTAATANSSAAASNDPPPWKKIKKPSVENTSQTKQQQQQQQQQEEEEDIPF